MSELAISNLAWNAEEDQPVAAVLRDAEVSAIEIAPTKVWAKPLEAPVSEIRAYRAAWEDRGFRIVAMQSLLFGRPDLRVLGNDEEQRELIAYMKGIIDIAAELGAGPLVFGSPKNRTRGSMSVENAMDRCAPVFLELGGYAQSRGACVCLEPNPPQYGCDFIVTSDEAATLVQMVDSPGFALHLDITCIEMAGEDPVQALHRHNKLVRHSHVSAPKLGPVHFQTVKSWMGHLDAAQANWRGTRAMASIEMIPSADGNNLAAVRNAVTAA